MNSIPDVFSASRSAALLASALWLEDIDYVTISVDNTKGIAMHYGVLFIPPLGLYYEIFILETLDTFGPCLLI